MTSTFKQGVTVSGSGTLTVSSSEQIFEVLLGKVDTVKFGNLFLQHVVLFLKRFDLLRSQTSGLFCQFITEFQVLRDCRLCLDFCLNLSNALVVLSLLPSKVVFLLDCKTHLCEFEQDFEVYIEVYVHWCMISL